MARRKSPLDQLTPNQRLLVIAALVVLAVGVAVYRGCVQQQPGPAPGPGQTLANRNVRFGMPAEAKAAPSSRDAYLIDRPQFVLSYNDSKGIPNWVCWNLTAADMGKAPRDLSFEPDPDLPKGFARVRSSDYDGGGFDRGHMCPSADRTDTPENNNVTFYMTNVVPQSPECNQKGWRLLEEYCRRLARDGNELYIACGPHGQGGTGRFGERKAVGTNPLITVPAAVWKVVLVLPNKDATPDAQTRAIAVWMPNDQTVTTKWEQYVVSVAEVETRTGYKFFPLVPDEVAGPIKGRTDRGP